MKVTTVAAGHDAPSLRLAPAPLLLLALLTLGLLLAGSAVASPGVALRADSPTAMRALVRFHGVEQNATDIYRWSEPLAGVFLYGYDGRPAIVSIRLAAPRPPESPPAEVAARAGDVALGQFIVGGDWRRYRILAPTRAAGESALLLQTPAFVPEGDPRELGFALSEFAVGPAGAARGVPPVRAIFLLTLPLIGWLLLTRLRAPRGAALAVGALLAALAGWAAAFPTASGYWLPTLGWPLWPVAPLLILAVWPWLGDALAAARARIVTRPILGWVGLGVALLALAGIRLGLPWPLGMGLLAAGVWAGLPSAKHRAQSAERQQAWAGWEGAAVLVLIAFALLLRLWDLDGQPAGLWRDESRHGLQALQIWSDPGYRPIYVVEGADLPALLFYLMAPVLGLSGPHAWSVRLVSALAGALTPLALYWAAAPMLGRRAALIAAALLAGASWSLSMSRWAFPATLDHLLVLTAVGLVWRCVDGGRRTTDDGRWTTDDRRPTTDDRRPTTDDRRLTTDDRRLTTARLSSPKSDDRRPTTASGRRSTFYALRSTLGMALAGVLGGLAVYAYHTGRVAPLALGAVVAIRLGASPGAWRRAAPGLAAAALAGALTVAPLAAYILGDLDGYNRRVGSVSILDSNDPETHAPLALVLGNLGRYLLMFHVRGDANGRHHMPEAPMLDPVAGLLLALGLGVALARARRHPGAAAALALGAVYLIPAVFSGNAPHAMRSLGTLAPAMMLAGLGLTAVAQSAKRKAQSVTGTPPKAVLRSALYASTLGISLLFNAWLYFGAMRVEPLVYGEFDVLETAVGRVAAAPAASADPALRAVRVYIPQALREEDTVRFLTWGLTTHGYTGDPLPADGDALVLLPGDASEAEQAGAIAALGRGAVALGPAPSYPGTDRPIMLAFGRGEAAGRLLLEALR